MPETARPAFTLIELLVVVAIIAILAAMLLPVLSQAKRQAQIVVCIGNLSQIARGTVMHLDDNDAHFPDSPLRHGVTQASEHTGFYYLGHSGQRTYRDVKVTDRPLNQYLGYTKDGVIVEVGICPLDYYRPGYGGFQRYYEGNGTSYFAAASKTSPTWDFDLDGHKDSRYGINISKVKRPSTMALIGDVGAETYAMPYLPFDEAGMWHKPGRPQYGLAFVDGHVENLIITREMGITHSFDIVDFTNR